MPKRLNWGVVWLLTLIFFGFENMGYSQVRIYEIMASNANSYLDPDFYNYPDWVELKNTGPEPISLEGYYISDDINFLKKWELPNITIDTDAYYLVHCDNEMFLNHTNFKLNAKGENIYLVDSTSQIIDLLSYPKQYPDVSFGFSAGDVRWHYTGQPTPGSENIVTNLYDTCETPRFSAEAGRYSNLSDLKILSSDTNNVIYYSTNGSIPTVNTYKYKGDINVGSTKVIRAKIFNDNYLPGIDAVSTYFINERQFTLPVVSISVDPLYLYNSQQGILIKGTNGIQKYCSSEPLNSNQDWERAAYLEYFDESGKRVIAQQIGIKIAGGCSRQKAQKSFSLYARDKYGKDEFNYAFFKEKPTINNYRSLMLRNSGNDFNQTMLRDAFMQALIKDAADIDHQAHQPVIVYLNGSYYGMMNLREKTDEDFLYSNYGIEDDNINYHIAVEFQIGTIRGSDSAYNALLDSAKLLDMSVQQNYEYVTSQIDLDEFMNYLIFQTYYANTDWPGHNNKFWQTFNGKWRWLLYDTDFGFRNSYDSKSLHRINNKYSTDRFTPPWSTLLFWRLIENDEFVEQFVQKYMVHINSTFHPDRCNRVLDSLADIIDEEMVHHRVKYGGSESGWNDKINSLKSWGANRYTFMPGYVESFFKLTAEPHTIGINKASSGEGKVVVNGVNLTHYPFSMTTYENIPTTITAMPGSGYNFSHWETSSTVADEEIISIGSMWKYLDEASDYPTNWISLSYDDSGWEEGNAQLGYGDGDESTVISYGGDPDNKIPTALFRKTFSVSDLSDITLVNASILADDGAIVYINGTEVTRANIVSGAINFSDYSGLGHATEGVYNSFSFDKSLLNVGNNIIAVEVHQHDATSSDLSFDLNLSMVRSNSTEPTFYSNEQTLSGSFNESFTISPVFTIGDSISGVTINELANTSKHFLSEYGEQSDYIELYNSTDDSIDVGGMFLTDDTSQPTKYRIPDTNPELTTIAPNDFLVFYADGYYQRSALHTNFNLKLEDKTITLAQKVGETVLFVDSLSYKSLHNNFSFGRYKDGSENCFYMKDFTPGSKNLYEQAITNIAAIKPNVEFHIYPNPAFDKLYVEIQLNQLENNNTQLVVFDISGRAVVVKNNLVSGVNKINISNISKGLYFVKFSINNKMIVTKKLIKQ